MNAGADVAVGDALLFLHADTTLVPPQNLILENLVQKSQSYQ
jgi:hypothetical protein